MDGWRTKKPSPSMAVAMLALFVALTGVATAGKSKTVKLKANSVKSKHIAPGAVGPSDLAPQAVTDVALADNAVRARSIRPGSVTDGKLGPDSVDETNVKEESISPSKLSTTFPNLHATRTADYAVPNTAATELPFDAELFDTANMHSTTTNNERVTIPLSGIYRITARLAWQGGDEIAATRGFTIRRNNSLTSANHVGSTSDYNVPAGTSSDQSLTTTFAFNQGDFIELWPIPGTTGTTIRQFTGQSPVLEVQYVAPLPG